MRRHCLLTMQWHTANLGQTLSHGPHPLHRHTHLLTEDCRPARQRSPWRAALVQPHLVHTAAGVLNSTAHLGEMLGCFSQKRNTLPQHDPARLHPAPRERNEGYVDKKTCTWLSTKSLLIATTGQKQPWLPPKDGRTNKLWYIHTVKYYLVIKRNELFIQAMTWILHFSMLLWIEFFLIFIFKVFAAQWLILNESSAAAQ